MIDSPIQVDLNKVSDRGLNNLKEVYAVMSLLLEEDNTNQTINDKDAQELLSLLQNIKVRDGVFKYFTILPKELRLDVLKNYTLHLDYAAKTYGNVGHIADATVYLGALMMIQAGFKLEINEPVDDEIEIYSGLLNDAEKLGSTVSLLPLLQLTIQHNIPATVFKDSIDAVPMEECVGGAN